ncbi:MAG: hypothetical protein J6Y22_00875, partial [Paludibacteraceae bacterium]|nr:hypothetical protein [Paludibacteraceae bacterium]
MGGLKYGCRFLMGLVSFILLGVSGAFAQGWPGGGGGTTSSCVINSTSFETSSSLCNPKLTNDEDGWFEESGASLKAEMKNCGETQEYAYKLGQEGVIATVTSPSKLFDSKTWAKYLKSQDGTDAGMTAIMKNPKLIDPILSEGNGTNMLVNAGTTHNSATTFFTYTITGLEPGSSVTLTADFYYLLDEKSLNIYYQLNGFGDNDQLYTGMLRADNSGKITAMPDAVIRWTTKVDQNGNPDLNNSAKDITLKKTTGAQSFDLTATAVDGSITFYFGRKNPDNTPIGIDNIEVKGKVKPAITYSGSPCPMMPVVLRTIDSYPSGTTYKWTVDGQAKSGKDMSSYSFEPQRSGEYKAKLSVTLPGCTDEFSSDEIKIKVGDCCQDDQGNPMALVNLYYNDFGRFNGTQYIYKDANGNEKTVRATKDMDGGAMVGRVPVIDDQLGKSTFNEKYNPEVYIGGGYSITTTRPNGYNGVNRDMSGESGGGMMILDIQSKGWMNKEIFRTKIDNLCKNRKIKFSVGVAALNSEPDDGSFPTNGTIRVELIDSDGNPIQAPDGRMARYDHVFKRGNSFSNDWANWVLDSLSFVSAIDLESVVLRVVSLEDDYYSAHRGDFALDNITFQVCAPPDVNVDYELTGNAPDLLNLCTGDTLTLDAIVSSAASRYYGTPYYLFQYTNENPETVADPEDIDWNDMQYPGTSVPYLDVPKFVIENPADDPAFASIASGDEADVYFRVVVADKTSMDLHQQYKGKANDPMKVSPLSPCRNVSVSTMIVRASLNCAKCHQSEDIKIKGDASGLTNNKVKKEKGYDVYSLCYGESLTLSSADVTTKINDDGKGEKPYADYLIEWYRDQQTTPESGYTVPSGSKAEDYTITNDNSGSAAKEVFLYVKTSDNFDVTAKHCQRWDTVKVILNPSPEAPTIDDIDLCEKVKPRKELKDRLKQNDFSDYTVNWYDGADPQSASKVSEPDLDALSATSTFYYSVTDKNTLCEGKTKSFEVEVHSTSNPLGTMKVSYLVKDTTSSGVFKDLLSQDASAVQTESGYTYIWFDKNQKLYKGDGKSVPVPDVPSLPLTDDVHETYYVARYDNTYGCWSDTLPVEVTIFGAPAPIPEDVYYCVGSSRVVPLTAEINDPNGVGTSNFKLVWYDPNKKLIGDDAPTPSVSKEGETIYFVSQKSNDGAESSLQPLSVKVYKAHQLSPISPDTYCDEEQNPNALVKVAEEGPNDYEQATDIQWYLYGDPWDKDKRPVLGIKKDTTYVFGAVQSYAVTTSTGVELETCYSDTTYYTVKVQYTPPTGDSAVAYIAAEVGSDNKTFPAITTKEGWSEEPGYTYYYSEAGKSNFSTSVPKPVYDVSKLNGGTTEIQYDVYRIKDGTNCPSEVKTITVSISDAMPPKVKDYHYCEGSSLQPISAEIRPISGKTENDYELYWYTSKPSSTTSAPEFTGSTYSLSGTAAVESDGTIKSTTYYVAQHDVGTGATSAAVEVHVVVYPKPILDIDDPDATCGSDNKFVDITGTWKASNTSE